MPLLKPCIKAGCGALSDKAQCPQHRPKDTRRIRHRPAHAATDWKWRKISEQTRAKQPWCSQCGTTNDLTVDHIIPVSVDPSLAYEPLNLDVLCRSCNGRKGDTITDTQIKAVHSAIHERNNQPPTI